MSTTPESTDPAGQPAPAVPKGLGLNELSEDEFKALILQGGTITIGEINIALGIATVDAKSLSDLGITTRTERRAVHMPAAGWPVLRMRLAERILKTPAPIKNKA